MLGRAGWPARGRERAGRRRRPHAVRHCTRAPSTADGPETRRQPVDVAAVHAYLSTESDWARSLRSRRPAPGPRRLEVDGTAAVADLVNEVARFVLGLPIAGVQAPPSWRVLAPLGAATSMRSTAPPCSTPSVKSGPASPSPAAASSPGSSTAAHARSATTLYARVPKAARRVVTERLDHMTKFLRSEPC